MPRLADSASFGPDLRALAALVSGAVDLTRFSRADLPGLIQSARSHGVAPILSWRLGRMGVDPTSADWEPLRRARDASLRHYLQLKAAFQQIDAALAHAGIPAVWLKGFALAHTVYPTPALRPMRDLDNLVPAARREDALACVQALGYALPIGLLQRRTTQELSHHYHLRGKVVVEVHYRPVGVGSKLLTPDQVAWFWTQTRTIRHRDVALTLLSPEAELLHLCAHAILQHGEREFLLCRYLDVHLLLEHYPRLDWPLVIARAADLRWTSAVVRALELTRECFGTPLPDGVLAEMAARRSADEAITRAWTLAPEATNLEATRHLLRGMSRREQWRWMVGLLCPGPAYMRRRYRIRAGWQLPFCYLWRWWLAARDTLKTMIRWLGPGATNRRT